MSEKLMSRIIYLMSKGYTIRFSPDVMRSCYAIRLTKDNHNVEQIINLDDELMSYAWKTDEERFLYILTHLEFKIEDYVKRLEEYSHASI